MSEESFQQQLSARRAAIREACPGASDEFVNGQLASAASVEAARTAYSKQLVAERDAAKARADLGQHAREQRKRGNDPIAAGDQGGRTSGTGGGAREEWVAAVDDVMKEYADKGRPINRSEAAMIANRRRPELREACVAEANMGTGY